MLSVHVCEEHGVIMRTVYVDWLQVSTLSEMTRHTASVATDDDSLDGLVIVDELQTTHVPGTQLLAHLLKVKGKGMVL